MQDTRGKISAEPTFFLSSRYLSCKKTLLTIKGAYTHMCFS